MDRIGYEDSHADLIEHTVSGISSYGRVRPIQAVSAGYCFEFLSRGLSVRIRRRFLEGKRTAFQILHCFRQEDYVFRVHMFQERAVRALEGQLVAAVRDFHDNERLRSRLLPRSPPPSRT